MPPPPGRQYQGLSPSERAERRRNQLLEAALELLGGGGSLDVTSVVAGAGLSPRYFYEAFGSVEELQGALFDSLVTEAEQRAVAALGTSRSALGRTRAVIGEMVSFCLDDPRRGYVLLIASLGSPSLSRRRVEELQRFAALLRLHGSPRGEDAVDSADAHVTASYAMGGFAEVISAALLTPRADLDQEQLVDTLVTLFAGTARSFDRLTRAREAHAAATR